MSKFQAIIIAISILGIIVGVLLFSFVSQKKNINDIKLVMWGTLPQSTLNDYFHALELASGVPNSNNITYIEKDPATFSQDLTEAVADGKAPDLVILPHDQLFTVQSRLLEIPYSSFSAREFKNTFIQESELLMTKTGIMALPISVDPLVMYWNRTLFSNAGLVRPPIYWDELLTLAPQLTQKDQALNIKKSAVALGEYRNVPHAKDILASLIMQAGSPLTAKYTTQNTNSQENQTSQMYKSVIAEKFDYTLVPGQAALDFYTQFSNPVKAVYSWNRSLQNARDAFSAGYVALYFGYASELPLIQKTNPNLNFDVTLFPQSREAESMSVFGSMMTIGVLKASQHIDAAYSAVNRLTSKDNASLFATSFSQSPARIDSLSETPSDPYQRVFYDSAVRTRGWYDPKTAETENIFKEMIESVVAGRSSADQALRYAHSALSDLLSKVQ